MAFWNSKANCSLEEYLKQCYTSKIPLEFKGVGAYELLAEQDLFVPYLSSIRLSMSHISDQHYYFVDALHVEGIELRMHAGYEGKHNIYELFNNLKPNSWSVNNLNHEKIKKILNS